MSALYYHIDDEVFERFPGYMRGVVLAFGVRNGESPAELRDMIRNEESLLRKKLQIEEVAVHPRIAAWREAFRSLGVKASEFRPSVEGLVRRVLRNQELPSINTLVDIGNLLAIRHILSLGGHALDEVRGNLELRFAVGTEEFIPFGSDQMEHPNPGEMIFVEGKAVLTRRWCWRQAVHTLTLPETASIEFNVDGLPPVTRAEIEAVCVELEGLIERFCGGRLRHEILDRDHRRLELK